MSLNIQEHVSFTCPSCKNYVLYIPYPDPVTCLKNRSPTCPRCGIALEKHKIIVSSQKLKLSTKRMLSLNPWAKDYKTNNMSYIYLSNLQMGKG